MDVITIIWYFSTFLLLILFFVVMVCSDNVCNRRRRAKPEEAPVESPPTPAPSYREFAPPGYDTVMQKYKNSRISVVDQPGLFSPMEPPPPASPLSIISELFEFPVVSRVSIHASPAQTDSAIRLVELRVFASSDQDVAVQAQQYRQENDIAVIIEEELQQDLKQNRQRRRSLSIITDKLVTVKSPDKTRSLSG